MKDRREGYEEGYEKMVEVKAERGVHVPIMWQNSAQPFAWKLPARDDEKQGHSDQQDRHVGACCMLIKLKVVALSQDFSVQYCLVKST